LKPAYAKQRYFTSAHHHFIEIREAINGNPYILIDQSTKKGEAFESQKLILFRDEVAGFISALQSALEDLETGSYKSKPVPHKVGELPQSASDGTASGEITPPKAYQSWSDDEASSLLRDHELKMSISELAAKYSRSPGAIRSKLAHLGKRWEEIIRWGY
jgi:hypothetical protein